MAYSPVKPSTPILIPKSSLHANGRSDSSMELFIVDPSPSRSVNALMPSYSFDDGTDDELFHSPGKSVFDDLALVLSLQEDEFLHRVKFQQCPPVEVEYQVSNDVDEETLKSPSGTYPTNLHSPITLSPREQIESSDILRDAAYRAEVKIDVDEEDESKMKINNRTKQQNKQNCSNATKKRKKIIKFKLTKINEQKQQKNDRIRENPNADQLITVYIERNQKSKANKVWFDKIAMTKCNGKTVILSSKGLTKGQHEWGFEILRSDVDLQEIGVIGTSDIERIPVSDEGAMHTAAFKSRSIYGSEMSSGSLCYGSWNADNKRRCLRDLTPYFNVGWTVGDVIKVELNLDKCRIKFRINGKAVRYVMSLEAKKTYFPMICFSGNCRYSQE